MSELTKEQKIAKIYAEIADKTRSLWCKYYYFQDWDDYEDVSINLVGTATVNGYNDKHPLLEKHIIWHPVMLWDVLDWAEANIEYLEEYKKFQNIYQKRECYLDIWYMRKEKRKPIDNQSDECINFVYSLTKDQWQTY